MKRLVTNERDFRELISNSLEAKRATNPLAEFESPMPTSYPVIVILSNDDTRAEYVYPTDFSPTPTRKVLVVYGDDRWYLDASTPERLQASSMELLRERLDAGYYDPAPGEIVDDRLTDEQIAALPVSLQEPARRHRAQITNEIRSRQKKSEFAALVRSLLQDPSSVKYTAWQLLSMRSNHERERVELETVDVIDP